MDGGDILMQKKQKKERQREKEIVQTNKDCPGYHGLIASQASDNTITECGECQKIMYLNEDMFGCKWCDYNLCIPCYKGENEKENKKELDECKTMRSEEVIACPNETNDVSSKEINNDNKRARNGREKYARKAKSKSISKSPSPKR